MEPANTDPAILPRWATGIGWACVAGSLVFSTGGAAEIAELPPYEIWGGVVDFFFPGPIALGMLLWRLGHIWIVVLALQSVQLKRKDGSLRNRDRLLLGGLPTAVGVGWALASYLASNGMRIATPWL